MLSETPIYDQLWLEQGWWDRPGRFMVELDPRFDAEQFKRERLGEWKSEPPTVVELEIAIDTSKFMRAIGHIANERAAIFERAMAAFSNSLIPMLEVIQYPAAVHELSRNTGWSLEESADMYQRVAKWSADAITKSDIEALGRSRMNKQNHYPTSTPTWARRKR